MKAWLKPIKQMGACAEALEWGEQYDSLEDAWDNCERGDHMLWLAGMLSGEPETASRKKLVLAVCECARLALPYVVKGELRPLKAIETAEKWAKSEDNINMWAVYTAAVAAAGAAAKDSYTYDANAAYSYAARAVYAATRAVNDANTTSALYAANAVFATTRAARHATLKRCADIARKHYPVAPQGVKERFR